MTSTRKVIATIATLAAIAVLATLWKFGVFNRFAKALPWGGNVTIVASGESYTFRMGIGKTYNITIMPGTTVLYTINLDSSKPYKVIVEIPYPGVNPKVDLVCSGVAIPFNVSGRYIIDRWPVVKDGKVIADKLCLYVNGTFVGCYIVGPGVRKIMHTVPNGVEATIVPNGLGKKVIRIKLHGIETAVLVSEQCSRYLSGGISGGVDNPKAIICDPDTQTCTHRIEITQVIIRYEPLS